MMHERTFRSDTSPAPRAPTDSPKRRSSALGDHLSNYVGHPLRSARQIEVDSHLVLALGKRNQIRAGPSFLVLSYLQLYKYKYKDIYKDIYIYLSLPYLRIKVLVDYFSG